ncbi:MAG TPA: NnrS family protein, partial [Casimicrobiaceae bacterium]|nr:NnrS family protein [Casimicrobiaceae bacterium]
MDEPRHRSGPRRTPSHQLFFPAAALYGAVALPWSVLAMTGVVHGPASLATPAGHAHEMLLGYALAVVAGYQLPPMPPLRLAALFTLWLAARVTWVAGPAGALSAVPDVAFAAALAWHVVPRFIVAAKKLRNLALPGILAGVSIAAAALDIAAGLSQPAGVAAIALVLVLLLAALMLFIGGRIIGPATAGQIYRQGSVPAVRLQTRIEGWLVVLMAIAIAAAPIPALEPLVRAACIAAGALALVRLLRWRLWRCRGRPDLLCLGTGYAWLALGVTALGFAAAGAARTAAIHAITVGALGT